MHINTCMRLCIYANNISYFSERIDLGIKTHDSESRGQEEVAVRDE